MVKISKILEGTIAQVVFDTTRMGVGHSMKDFLMLAILDSRGSMAYRTLSSHLAEWQLYQIMLQIDSALQHATSEGANPAEFFSQYMETITAQFSCNGSRVTTIDALKEILSDSTTVSSIVFRRHGISADTIDRMQLALC